MAESIGAGYARSKTEGDTRTARLLEIASLAQREMKALLAELRLPTESEHDSLGAYARANGLAKALKHHSALTAAENTVVHIDINDNKLNEAQTEALLRIAQEAMANAFRHGKAQSVRISLDGEGEKARFRVEDDGDGITEDAMKSAAPGTSGIGVASMRARAATIDGILNISALPSRGVCVEVLFPLA